MGSLVRVRLCVVVYRFGQLSSAGRDYKGVRGGGVREGRYMAEERGFDTNCHRELRSESRASVRDGGIRLEQAG